MTIDTLDGSTEFKEALAIAKRKQPLLNDMPSADLAKLEQDVLQRAVFSARMDKAGFVQAILDTLKNGVSNQHNERGVFQSVAESKAQLREAAYKAGVPLAEAGTPKIQDFYSDTRRDLIVRTNLLDTLGFGQHVAGQNPAMLFVAPAQELVRFSVPKGGEAAERDWPERWSAALDACGQDDGATDPDETDGRMVALKNHPIWQALGDGAGGYDDTLGNAWAPFAFNSGMGTIPVTRADAVDLGIIDEDEEVQPDTSFDMNENLQGSVAKFSAGVQAALDGGGLQILDGVLSLISNDRRRRGMRGLMLVLNSGTPEGAIKGWETRRAGMQAEIRKVVSGEKSESDYGDVSGSEAGRIKKATGLDVRGFKHSIDRNALIHFERRHGASATLQPGESPITKADLDKLPDIVAHPDQVLDGGVTGRGVPCVKYVKKIGDQHFFVEEIWTGEKRLVAKTFYKRDATLGNRATSEEGVVHTSKTSRVARSRANLSLLLNRIKPELQEAS